MDISNEALHDMKNLHINANHAIMEIKENEISFYSELTENSSEWFTYKIEAQPNEITRIFAHNKQYIIDTLIAFKPLIDFEVAKQ